VPFHPKLIISDMKEDALSQQISIATTATLWESMQPSLLKKVSLEL